VTLSNKLRVLRAERGLSLVEVAKRASIGRDTLSDLEKGRRHPTMATINRLADAYGVPVEELLGEAPSEETTAHAWARRQRARLHGMAADEWDDHVLAHDTQEGLVGVWHELHNESKMLHAALAVHKWQRPQDRGRRRQLGRGLRNLRMGRYSDLQARAYLLHAEDLINEIASAMREEAALETRD